MEINSTSRPIVDSMESSQAVKKQNESATAANTLSGSADTFNMTNKASQLQALEAQIAKLPVVDSQRVNDVQHALSTGTLKIDPPQVADKMLQFEAGLADG